MPCYQPIKLMNTLPRHTLQEAMVLIEVKKGRKILGIEYEDGSGLNYNVRFFGSNKWEFVRLY